MLEQRIGCLGYGNMGQAILEGLIAAGYAPERAIVCDPDPGRREAAAQRGVPLAESPAALAEDAEILLLAVKPQQMQEALDAARPAMHGGALYISIAAGLPLRWFEERLPPQARVVRVMPNTPSLVGAGAAGIAGGAHAAPEDLEAARMIFESVGVAAIVPESQLDAVTALSGSGPAYCFLLAECLATAAEKEGLAPEVAARLAAQTLYGAGRLLAESGEDPATLRGRVTSKGGTTEAAIRALQDRGFPEAVAAAVAAAAKRSRELAGG